jgi:Zn-dependent M28 family amino/carboxypeptidase
LLRNQDYRRIERLLADGERVALEFDILNESHPTGFTSYYVFAEIPGTLNADEVVFLGEHLDSSHAATGAGDDAIGCAVLMETARIIQTVGLRPKRTIRFAFWSGEEQGALGSTAYVQKHRTSMNKVTTHIEADMGAGRVRGALVQGPREAADIVRDMLRGLAQDGVIGATADATAANDNRPFADAGVPTIRLALDLLSGMRTYHTDLDTFDQLVETDARQRALVSAVLAVRLANADSMLPRKKQ